MADEMVRVRVKAGKLLKRFDRLPSELQQAVLRGLRRELLLTEEEVRRNAEVKFSGSGSGLLSRLTSYSRKGDGKLNVDAAIGFRKTRGFPYEMSQEYGAKAKPGGAMTIPISDEARRAADEGRGPRELGYRLRVRQWIDDATLVQYVGDRVVNHYLLVKSIPPRLHFRESVMGSMDSIMAGIVNEVREVKRKGGGV